MSVQHNRMVGELKFIRRWGMDSFDLVSRLLKANGIEFEVRNEIHRYIIKCDNRTIIDMWPSLWRWISRSREFRLLKVYLDMSDKELEEVKEAKDTARKEYREGLERHMRMQEEERKEGG